MRSVHETHLPAARARLGQTRFQLVLQKRGLLLGVLCGRRFGRHGDGASLAWCQPQTLQEAAHLGKTAADAGPLFDDLLSLFDGSRRVLVEVLLQGSALRVQGTDRTLVWATPDQ